MTLDRNKLPQLAGDLFLTDGGLETTLVFREGIELPGFAAFVLLETDDGCEILRNYFRRYANIARDHNVGFILESVTWRANQAWGERLGYSPEQLDVLNRKAIELLQGIRREYEAALPHIVISGCIGPRGDGYQADTAMTATEAAAYHCIQVATLRETEADMLTAMTIPSVAEGIGIALAAKSEQMPVAISFTLETVGTLPSGETLKDAIEQVDATTDNSPAYYMINCAHPTHFVDVLENAPWASRIRGVRANASARSHAESDEATELDAGDPKDLSSRCFDLRQKLQNLNVVGGCCGTDHRHVAELCRAFVQGK